jgi:hypothetical protein
VLDVGVWSFVKKIFSLQITIHCVLPITTFKRMFKVGIFLVKVGIKYGAKWPNGGQISDLIRSAILPPCSSKKYDLNYNSDKNGFRTRT